MTVTTTLADIVPAESLDGEFALPPGVIEAEPLTIVAPGDVDEVRAVLEWAAGTGHTVLPLGTGRHLEKGALGQPAIGLSVRRITGIQIYESADLTITAGAGTLVSELGTELGAASQWLPFDPPDAETRTMGGLIASGRTGPSWAGYGALRNHVLGATVVCGDGRVLRLGGRVVKNVAGFDTLRPVVGSRGALCVVVAATLRAFPLPVVDRALIHRTEDRSEAVRVSRALATAPVRPASTVLSWSDGIFEVLLRLHGAEATVTADLATLSKEAGVEFEDVSGSEREDRIARVRDLGWDASIVLRGATLPSELGRSIEAAGLVPGSLVWADVHSGVVRIAAEEITPEGLDSLRDAFTGAGGTLRLVRGAEYASPGGGPGSERVRRLEAGVKTSFDPDGVLWAPAP